MGTTETSLGRKKARLAFTRFDPNLEVKDRAPRSGYEVKDFDLDLLGGGNVFSGRRLDLGTRVLLDHLPATEEPVRIADLGCGNGVLALALARSCPNASILGIDESYQAVDCARRNAVRACLASEDNDGRVSFEVADGLVDVPPASLDLIVCNPPFHQGQSRGDQIAWELFRQSRMALAPGGKLYVVGNRHLGYHLKLRRLFLRCESLAAHPKFVVLRASLDK